MSRTAVLVRELYAIQRRLREAFPGRRFSLDGKLVGDLGEVIAADLRANNATEGNGQ